MSNIINKKLFKILNTRPISFNAYYSTICGTNKMSNLTNKIYLEKNQGAGILLSQLLYWYSTMEGNEFYKLDSELIEECGCSEYSYQKNKKLLIIKGFVKCVAKHPKSIHPINQQIKIDMRTITHWTINEDAITEACLNSRSLGGAELSSSREHWTQQFQEVLNSAVPILTEITTEITTDSSDKQSANKTPIIIPNTTIDLRNNLSTLCSILRVKQEDLQPNQMMKVKKLVTINFDLLNIYLKQIPLQLDNPVATLGSNLNTLLKILDIITQSNFKDLSEQELEGLFEFIDKKDNLDFYLQQALTENNKPSKVKKTVFLMTNSLMNKALTIKENYNIASIINNEKKVEIDYSSFFEIK